MSAQPKQTITTESGNTVAVAASSASQLRDETYALRVEGDNVFFGFGEPAVVDQGIFLKAGESMVVSGIETFIDLYAVSEGTSYLYVEA